MNILTDKILLFAILLTFIFFFQPWFPGDILLEEKPVSAIQMLLNLDDVDIPFLPSYNILRMVLMVPLFSILILLMLYLKLEPKSVRTYLFFLGFICMSVFLYLLDLAIEYYAIAENFSFMEAYGFFVTWFLFGVMLISVVISQMRKFEHFLIIGAGILFSIIAYNIITVPFFQSGPFCYLADNLRLTGIRTLEHLRIVLISISIAILSGVPIGIYISRHEKIADVTLYITSIIITIPSIALFGFMMPILSSIDRAWDAVEGIGIGTVPAVIALALYSQLPIIRNTY
ncbi:MAG: hypothetical protein GY864_15720, partial [Desulfobacterales bacterium]|nr:hypothetical protein [Desulfobacterales bacterium]